MARQRARGGAANKTPVVTLVEHDGEARSQVMEQMTSANVGKALHEQMTDDSRLMTDNYIHMYRTGVRGSNQTYHRKAVKIPHTTNR